MIVYISKYRDHWFSPYKILEKVFFWKKIDYRDPLIEKLSDYLNPFCVGLKKVLDIIHPEIRYVKVGPQDHWSADFTMTLMLLPIIKQLRGKKQGAPFTDDEDVPEYLRSTAAAPKKNDWDTDEFHFMRWEWIIDEIIWSMEFKIDKMNDDQFYDEKTRQYDIERAREFEERMVNGFKLFGKYYHSMWS
jgi:hypothetical protein